MSKKQEFAFSYESQLYDYFSFIYDVWKYEQYSDLKNHQE